MEDPSSPWTTIPTSSPPPLHTVSKPICTSISSRLLTLLLQFFYWSISHAIPCLNRRTQSVTFGPPHVQLMHKPLSDFAPPQFLSQLSPQHVQLGLVNLASHKPNAAHRRTTIFPSPLNAFSPSPRSAGSGHCRRGAPPIAPPPAYALRMQTYTACASAAAASSRQSRHKIRAAVLVFLVPLMILDMLERAS
jgi:hypothetical protein